MKELFTTAWEVGSKIIKCNVTPGTSTTGADRQEGWGKGAVAVSHAKVSLQGVVAFGYDDSTVSVREPASEDFNLAVSSFELLPMLPIS